ncbi:AraC family transcriptional regulator [Nocardia sp. NPDC059228]|uniref:AraC family transcriptional regulator n=1 Tax=Nocardia sp. NPDC059228 TaxID=3346777 RepID=UPI0036CE413A
MSSLIRATNLRGYSTLVRQLGGDPEKYLARFQLPINVEHEPDAFIPFRAGAGMIEATADELLCPDFGLRLSQWQGLDILGPVAVIVRNARTLREALTEVARFMYAHSPALHLEVKETPRKAELIFHYEITEQGLSELRQAYELSIANFARIVALLSGGSAHLEMVSFMHHKLSPDSSYENALGCPVRFNQTECLFQVSASLSDKLIDSADPETHRLATKYLKSEFLHLTPNLSDRVAALSRRLLPVGRANSEAIAEQLAMHPRTLQRRLAEEGMRCHDIVDEERRKLAMRYLAEPRLYLGQISGLLGFSEQSSLNRACQRWFGATPGEYRAQLAAATTVSGKAKSVSREAKT